MSLEESMKELAASQSELAKAMTLYATTMQNIAAGGATQIAAPAVTVAADATPPKSGRGRKPAEKEAAEPTKAADVEVDPFADDEPAAAAEPELTAEVIRGLVMKVKDQNKDHALALLKKVGASTIGQIAEKDYPKIVELAAKVGVTL